MFRNANGSALGDDGTHTISALLEQEPLVLLDAELGDSPRSGRTEGLVPANSCPAPGVSSQVHIQIMLLIALHQ